MKQVVFDMDWADLLMYVLASFFCLFAIFGLLLSAFGPEKYRFQVLPEISVLRVLACTLSVILAYVMAGMLLKICFIVCAVSASVPIILSLSHANAPAIHAASLATLLVWISLFGIIFGRCMIVLKSNTHVA